jgi:hypothetical protein
MAFDPVPWRERIVGPDGKLTTAGIVWFRWLDKLRGASVASADMEILQVGSTDFTGIGVSELEALERELVAGEPCYDGAILDLVAKLVSLERHVAVSDAIGSDQAVSSLDARVTALEALMARVEAVVSSIQEVREQSPEQLQIGDASRDLDAEIESLKMEMAFSDVGLGGSDGTATLLKLTALGTDGSMKVENGRITALVSPT